MSLINVYLNADTVKKRTGHMAQGTGHMAHGTGHRAHGSGRKAKISKLKSGPNYNKRYRIYFDRADIKRVSILEIALHSFSINWNLPESK